MSITVLSLVGLFILFLIAEFQNNPAQNICELEIGERARVCGYARDISSYSNVTFFVIEGSDCLINGVVFDEVLFSEGDYIFQGKVEMYEGEKEMIVNKILTYSC